MRCSDGKRGEHVGAKVRQISEPTKYFSKYFLCTINQAIHIHSAKSFPQRLVLPVGGKTHRLDVDSRILCQKRFQFLRKRIVRRSGEQQVFDDADAEIDAFHVSRRTVNPQETGDLRSAGTTR